MIKLGHILKRILLNENARTQHGLYKITNNENGQVYYTRIAPNKATRGNIDVLKYVGKNTGTTEEQNPVTYSLQTVNKPNFNNYEVELIGWYDGSPQRKAEMNREYKNRIKTDRKNGINVTNKHAGGNNVAGSSSYNKLIGAIKNNPEFYIQDEEIYANPNFIRAQIMRKNSGRSNTKMSANLIDYIDSNDSIYKNSKVYDLVTDYEKVKKLL